MGLPKTIFEAVDDKNAAYASGLCVCVCVCVVHLYSSWYFYFHLFSFLDILSFCVLRDLSFPSLTGDVVIILKISISIYVSVRLSMCYRLALTLMLFENEGEDQCMKPTHSIDGL